MSGSMPAARCRSGRRAPARRPDRSATTRAATTPTITDANVLLGYINPAHLVGGALKLNAEKARAAFAEKIAKPLGMPLEQAAYGAHLIAASNMIRAIKAVSTERGRDPREFALFAFGGNGPLFAAGMAAALGISRIVVPPSAGLFSSFGLLYADVEHHYRAHVPPPAAPGRPRRDRSAPGTRWRGRRASSSPRKGSAATRARLQALGRAALQGPELRADRAGARRADRRSAWSRISRRRSAQEHERTYGHRAGPEEPVELVAIQLVGSGPARRAAACRERVQSSRAGAAAARRRARPISAPSTAGSRRRCCAARTSRPARDGPLIVEEYDATCLVPPGARAERDAAGNIVIELPAG